MNTSPIAPELFESTVRESLSMSFFFGFCFLFFSLVLFFSFFANRKEEEWHMATRGE